MCGSVSACVREQQQQTFYLDIFKYALATFFLLPCPLPRLSCLLVAEFKVAPSHASVNTPPSPPPRPLPLPPPHTLRLQPAQLAQRQKMEWGTGKAEMGQIRAALSGNVLNISILFGLHVTGVLPGVSPWAPPLPSPDTALSRCRLYLSLGHFISFDTFSVNFFCRHCCTSHFASPCQRNCDKWKHICINKYVNVLAQ